MKLDLETLKQVKFTFDIHSDHSTTCNGYRSLCRMIEEAEKEVNENLDNGIIADVTGSKINTYYPVFFQSPAYKKLLVIQTIPETKYWFKDEEVTIEKLIHILETA